jgi:hypothetical protein
MLGESLFYLFDDSWVLIDNIGLFLRVLVDLIKFTSFGAGYVLPRLISIRNSFTVIADCI